MRSPLYTSYTDWAEGMKRYEYSLIIVTPPFLIIFVSIFILDKFLDRNRLRRLIAKNVFSDVLKEKREGGTSKWLFKDIHITSEKGILPKVLNASYNLFRGILIGTTIIFCQILLFETSSECDLDDPSRDCFEFKSWGWPNQDPVNCSSAAIQNVFCIKIVFNLGLASGASYGVFKLCTLAFSLGSSVFLMIENPCCQRAFKIIIWILFVLTLCIPYVLMYTPFGVAFLSNNLIVLLQTLITLANSVIFVWRIPWDKLTELNGKQNNPNNTGLENRVAATDDN